MKQITRGVWSIEGLKMGRSYLIEERDALTLIDSSSADVADRILAAIAKIGRKPEDLSTIVATHYHYDHTGNAAALRERTGASICAHAEDAPYIDGRRPWGTGRPLNRWERLGERMQSSPAPFTLNLDQELRDGDELPIAGGLRVVHAPGHTPGHVALHAPQLGVLFAGDAFMNILGLRPPAGGSNHDSVQAKESIRMLSKLDFEHALPGHGPPILSHASDKLAHWSAMWL